MVIYIYILIILGTRSRSGGLFLNNDFSLEVLHCAGNTNGFSNRFIVYGST